MSLPHSFTIYLSSLSSIPYLMSFPLIGYLIFLSYI